MVAGGGFREPHDVLYFTAIMYNPNNSEDPIGYIEKLLGDILFKTEKIDFSHTNYYVYEFGAPLLKYFVSFKSSKSMDYLKQLKLETVRIEDNAMIDGKRIFNIDPGYISAEKIVVSSTKNFSHRVYIGDNVFADMQLFFKKGLYLPFEWSYEDYQKSEVLELFYKTRKHLPQLI